MYLIAALMFLITGLLGLVGDNGAGANITFIVLSLALLILALNAWASTDGSNNS